jgi:hypothetical protein
MAGIEKNMDHAAYMKKVRKMDKLALLFTIDDCRKVLAAQPDNPNSGYYQDEIHYCSMELQRRQRRAINRR